MILGTDDLDDPNDLIVGYEDTVRRRSGHGNDHGAGAREACRPMYRTAEATTDAKNPITMPLDNPGCRLIERVS
jgi:hypothetical protein